MVEVKNKLLIRICLMLSISGFMFQTLEAQDKFHRLYPNQNDKNVLSLDAIQTKDGSYIALHIELEEQENPQDTLYGDTLIITSFKPKGDVNWSKSISLSGKYKSFNPQLSSLIQGQNDSIYYSVTALEDNLPVNLLGSLHINGNPGFLKASGVSTSVADNSGESNLLLNYNKALFNAYGAASGGDQSIHLSKKDYKGNIAWIKSLQATVGNNKVYEAALGFELADDTTFIMTGILDTVAPKPFITVLDTLGNPLMSKFYTDSGFLGGVPLSYNAHKFSDGTYVLTGYLIEIISPFEFAIKGFIIKTDARGNVSWSKKLEVNRGDFTLLKHSIIDRDNNLVIAGANFSLANQEVYPFMAKIDKAGKIIWKKKYDRSDSSFDFTGTLFQARDQGYVYYTSASKDDLSVPSFIKTDKDGASGCESELTENLIKDNVFKADTLVWKVATISNITENVLAKSKAHTFEVPVLSLDVRPFCPNEPIDWTFDASVEGATKYLWNDKSTADTLRVFAEGEYSVMVTIDEDVCYTLCDTAKIERYTKPQALINLSLGNFCTNGKQTLALAYNPGHPQVKSVTWSTGETGVTSIEIATPGTYRVTVVDQCDETATALINVGPFPQKLSAATITGDPTVNCIRGTISGLLTASGNAVGLGDMTYRWSTGASTAVLSLNDSEVLTYTVTVTDICGTTATATKVVELKGSNTDFQITKSNSGVCKDKTITLNIVASTFSPKLKYNWSNGQNSANISTSQAGTYTATLTDGCNNRVTKQIEISPSEFEIKDLVFAKLFFPDGTLSPNEVDTTAAYRDAEKYNRTFGPVNLPEYCIQDVTDYELHVFNRWGQEVFVSDDIFKEWDGTYQDQQAPTESYLWVARYKILGTEKTLKGSVTMLRR